MVPVPLLLLLGAGAIAIAASSGSKSTDKRGKSVRPECQVKPIADADLTEQQRALALNVINTPKLKSALVSVLSDLGYDDDPAGILAFQEDFNSWVAYQVVRSEKQMQGVEVDGKMNLSTVLALISLQVTQAMAISLKMPLMGILEWEQGINFCK